jgi:hypothetical protein
MWSRIAEEMAIPWRAAEAMHWQMGEHEMARRAGVTPFTLANTNVNAAQPNHSSVAMHRHSFNPAIQLPPSMITSIPPPRDRRNSGPSSLHGPPQLPSLAELTAGFPAFAPHPPAPHSTAGSPYAEYPGRRSLPPTGHTGTAFDHLPPPGSLTGRPTTPTAGQSLPIPNSYFPTNVPARELTGRRY